MRDKCIKLLEELKEREILAIPKKRLMLAIYDFISSDRRTAKVVFDLLVASKVVKQGLNGICKLDYSRSFILEKPLGWLDDVAITAERKKAMKKAVVKHIHTLANAKVERRRKRANK